MNDTGMKGVHYLKIWYSLPYFVYFVIADSEFVNIFYISYKKTKKGFQ